MAQTTLILAYDDLASINYFGEWRKAYWTTKYKTILEAISAAFADQKKVYKQASEIDCEIEAKRKRLAAMSMHFYVL